jgi:hypothetical protein
MLKNIKDTLGKATPARKKELFLGRRLIPLLISGLIIYYYAHRVNWTELSDAVLGANLLLFIPARFIPLFIYLLVDSYLLKLLLDWFHQPIPYRKVVYPRAALYLLALIHIQFSNGGMFLYLMRASGVKAEKLAGMVAFRFAWSVWSINFGLTMAMLATFLLGWKFHSPLGLELILLGIGIIWATLALCLGLVYYHHRHNPGAYHRPLWSIFFEARPRQYLEVAGWTLLLAVIGVINNYLCAISFGIRIPVHELVVQLPIAELIAAVPIAFAGLGTTTFAWQTLFQPYASPAMFLSLTIALPVTTYLARAIFALFALPRATKDVQDAFSSNSSPESQ